MKSKNVIKMIKEIYIAIDSLRNTQNIVARHVYNVHIPMENIMSLLHKLQNVFCSMGLVL